MFEQLIQKYPALASVQNSMEQALQMLHACFINGNKILVCGNGGSAADAEHIVGELMKSFMLPRPLSLAQQERLQQVLPQQPEEAAKLCANLEGAIPALSLVSGVALPTAFANDVAAEYIFAQQVFALGRPGDVLLAISTSGNSANLVQALRVARAFGLKTLGLSGRSGGAMAALCDVEIRIALDCTPDIQELHLPVYHALCAELEKLCFYQGG